MTRRNGALRSVLVVALLSGRALAEPVAIANAGFEEPVLASGQCTNSVPGWAIVQPGDGVGVYHIDDFPGGAPEGANTGYLNGVGVNGAAAMVQVLSESLTGGTRYTLEVLVVRRGNPCCTDISGYEIQLLAGDTVRASSMRRP